MKRKLTISFALLMVLFGTVIPGVYAMDDNGNREMPEMDAAQMQEMTLEMLENSIDSLTELQSELEDEDLLDSVDSLLEEMETIKIELEATDDEEEIASIMEEFRTSMEDVPDEIREALIQDSSMGEKGNMKEGDRNMQAQEGEGPENGVMEKETAMNDEDSTDRPVSDETPADKPDNDDASEKSSSITTSDKNTGLLNSLINAIKSLF